MTIRANKVGKDRNNKQAKRDSIRLAKCFVNNLENDREINSENGDLIDLYLSHRGLHRYFQL